ncbi:MULTISPECIES: hypothetical protein [Pseudomonas syringae group]|uniref:Uncharacterized protein n=1 Tax=Pseudomonas syringae pv. tomato (strain ATCC BAA-871 / DC3000) TaxID=223283 RepID=Q87W31_PSESM|nr:MULTISPECIES: hypothetical protein [Pseudomonas syringae group]AAO58178.1 hypothetical protein PSPTO_4747 [Pseudomonas syringae pv. tomato str. DC3000]
MKPSNKQGSSLSAQAVPGIQALRALLVDVIKRPLQFSNDEELHAALKTQGGIAKLSRSIIVQHGEVVETLPMSLNSLKTYADQHLPGGFKGLNDLRLKATDSLQCALKQGERANKRTRSGLTLKVAQLEHEMELHRQTNMILTRALSESLHQFVNIRDASSEHVRKKFTQDATETIFAILSMAMPPFNVIDAPHSAPAPSADIANLSDYRKG